MTTEIRDAVIVDVDGYKLPERSIEGHICVKSARREDTARLEAAKHGEVAFILRWYSEVGNPVFGLYVTEATYYARRAAAKVG